MAASLMSLTGAGGSFAPELSTQGVHRATSASGFGPGGVVVSGPRVRAGLHRVCNNMHRHAGGIAKIPSSVPIGLACARATAFPRQRRRPARRPRPA